MNTNDISSAVKQICDEKGLTMEDVISTIEAALSAAYRKDYGEKNQNIKVNFDITTGGMEVYDEKTVVEDMPEDPSASLRAEAQAEGSGLAGDVALFGTSTMASDDGGDGDSKKATPRLPLGKLGVRSGQGKQPLGTTPSGPSPSGRGRGKESKKTKDDIAVVADISKDNKEAELVKKFNPKTEIQVSEAQNLKKKAKIGDVIRTPLKLPSGFGRMAAQTAKQVIIQKLREAERNALYNDFKEKEGEVMTGVIQRREGRNFSIDLGKIMGVLPYEEQIPRERYNSGSRFKVYILSVENTPKGPLVAVSRTHPNIVKQVFSVEIPEIANNLIEIRGVAREPGMRSKIAVESKQENIDPIGSCVGQRGTRVQTIIGELGGEKVDIIEYEEKAEKFIANALSPAKISSIETYDKEKKAIVKVKEDQLSLAIGRGGQNVRLAGQLTGWKLDIVAEKESGEVEKVVEEGEVVKAEGGPSVNSELAAGEGVVEDGGEEKKQPLGSARGEQSKKANESVAGDDTVDEGNKKQ